MTWTDISAFQNTLQVTMDKSNLPKDVQALWA